MPETKSSPTSLRKKTKGLSSDEEESVEENDSHEETVEHERVPLSNRQRGSLAKPKLK